MVAPMAPAPTGQLTPRIIIHGGAGNITASNLPPALQKAHFSALQRILLSTTSLLSDPTTTALDAATHAVSLLELDPLYNAGRGAVFHTAGRIAHEASVMVSTPHPPSGHGKPLDLRKRACCSVGTSTVKHPILLCKEMLLRGRDANGGGAGGHNTLAGETAEGLARAWGLETERPSWFWTKNRWDQHRLGLGLSATDEEFEAGKRAADADAGFGELAQHEATGETEAPFHRIHVTEDCGLALAAGWNGTDYLPQGTVGAVVLDRFGTVCAATSTGGMTNKLPGRIGDTPTIGAGFWAESWSVPPPGPSSPLGRVLRGDWAALLRDVLPEWVLDAVGRYASPLDRASEPHGVRAVGMSGTGNGDSFLRLCAVRTAAAISRFGTPSPTLEAALARVAGRGGLLQQSAEDDWSVTGSGEGGIIGIELRNGRGYVCADWNCGGMFHAWIDDGGRPRVKVFH